MKVSVCAYVFFVMIREKVKVQQQQQMVGEENREEEQEWNNTARSVTEHPFASDDHDNTHNKHPSTAPYIIFRDLLTNSKPHVSKTYVLHNACINHLIEDVYFSRIATFSTGIFT